jgi:hypothetical protein
MKNSSGLGNDAGTYNQGDGPASGAGSKVKRGKMVTKTATTSPVKGKNINPGVKPSGGMGSGSGGSNPKNTSIIGGARNTFGIGAGSGGPGGVLC